MAFWKTWTFNIKFSVIAFLFIAIFGLLSLGALGLILYYPVSPLFVDYPNINEWYGDWVWPTLLTVGMLWSFGFVFAAIAWYYLSKITASKALLCLVYVAILWIWDALLWWVVIRFNSDQFV